MKNYFLYASLLIAGLFTACSEGDDEIDTSVPFYQNLGVEYNITDNSTHVGANFNKYNSEGPNLRLPDGAILFNGEKPDFLNQGTYFYKMSFTGLPSVTFTFARAKDMVYVNEVNIDDANLITIPASFNAIAGNGATTLTWDGAPLAKNEYVQVHLTYNGGVYDVYNRTEGASSITLNFNNQTSATGGTLFLSRVTSLPLQQSNGNAGGKIDVSYSVNKPVSFE
jgi:hypothetical protein